ncbi:hypothetical protein FGG08_006725 [Glutinoglossum americanum]|uniref:Uncharacterized protein n=1 Tax=Glutinoglossum americanum TaxID=1670608 RepID=A0A9P8HXQ4_9PEZI|nr:hypothetical protein FGG08_006725 [Glutinoglossum americanum]
MSSFDDDGSPPPDNDPETLTPPYDLSNVSQPPSLARFFGYSPESLQRLLHHRLTLTSQRLQRPLTRPETDALIFWTARNYTIGSYGPLLGTAGGIALALRTRSEMTFPFYRPGRETVEGMKAGRIGGWELGSRGVMGWQAVRGLTYGALGSWFGRVVVAGYAVGVAVVGESGDERLRGVMEGMGGRGRRVGAAREDTGAMSFPGGSEYSRGAVNPPPSQDREQKPRRTPRLSPPPTHQQDHPADPPTSLDSGDRLLSDTEMQPTTPPPDTYTPQSTWTQIRASALSPASQPRHQSAWHRARDPQSRTQPREDSGFAEGPERDPAVVDKPDSRAAAQRAFDDEVERERRGAGVEDEGAVWGAESRKGWGSRRRGGE